MKLDNLMPINHFLREMMLLLIFLLEKIIDLGKKMIDSSKETYQKPLNVSRSMGEMAFTPDPWLR